jgi:hypothetical protein
MNPRETEEKQALGHAVSTLTGHLGGQGEVEMQLRHIRPRSVEWYDAVEEERVKTGGRMSPEEQLRLRTLVAMEATGDQQGRALVGLAGGELPIRGTA